MSWFNTAIPILRPKQYSLDFQDRQGLLNLKLQVRNKTIFHSIYSRVDQAFFVWGLITAVIFFTAQFAAIPWITQAIFWSILTGIGTILMTILTHFWVKVEQLRWLLYSWIALMLGGVTITDLGIVWGWGTILIHICHLWLGLSAVGYFCSAVGLKSRAFILAGLFHLVGIALLPFCGAWQFLVTGLIITSHLLIFAENQWDMRPPIYSWDIQNNEQSALNREQYLICQTKSL